MILLMPLLMLQMHHCSTLLDAYNKGQDMRYAANALRFNKESVPKYWQDRFDYLADKLMK